MTRREVFLRRVRSFLSGLLARRRARCYASVSTQRKFLRGLEIQLEDFSPEDRWYQKSIDGTGEKLVIALARMRAFLTQTVERIRREHSGIRKRRLALGNMLATVDVAMDLSRIFLNDGKRT